MATTKRIDYTAGAHTWAGEAADLWVSIAGRRACAGIFGRMYLYVRPTGDYAWVADQEAPDASWEIADQEGYGANLTRENVAARIRRIAERLPIVAWIERHAA